MALTIPEITEKVKEKSRFIAKLISEISRVIVGQQYLIERLLLGILSNGHILVEGVPGLAKTTAVKTLAKAINTKFQRIQFTPDLLPADLLGTQIYLPKDGIFTIKKGPIFSNIILADEINRAPAKVQSALLEAMQERQVTLAEQTFKLEEPFLVMATQNPIEQEGTYPLPEAQVDRFMLKLRVSYPNKAEEKEIMKRVSSLTEIKTEAVIEPSEILEARKMIEQVYIDEKIQDYIVAIVFATRNPSQYGLNIGNLIQYGASPRASIYLNQAAKAYAFIQGRGYVTPQDVKLICPDILRHRIILSYEAEAENLTTDDIIRTILEKIDVP
ncbi:MAG: ATPase [Candidatus Schekmanbacteria bacterium RIFCSPHIGHO2_02_FULL_38_11]|uniref:ATPase n=1 Tax=Candidatus Schekmanbacteria bacterium RIFCSPLOWO2_12_FULL_38_15 TaxID=1817883 RepID=A0A1F7SCA6_9BACT|nr:MAG: ATPase [Candidatus Schekmanbacteria bacterium GWA2_38_9]OGL51413.1 MAG: ATPase [Candidatus Schekmanbacteria bacterium RIFCSPLOWO2_12_FULL_38_15]OGL51580.1 MAG: ATPase [Candidatus Schekmanbacteria bacterium RIFCSPLOWO2_02_FULL_38_14]OGL53203.1 MAG: ATPase [Candidatus Schekmanbacteria bacterium RIFCSPHIGHO2_02_FULL_38_11]